MAQINFDKSAELMIITRKGDSFEMSFTGVQIDGSDITSSYDAVMKVRASESASPILSWETPNEIVITTGAIAITETATNMDAVTSGTYLYDLEVTYPDNTVHTWLHGTFIIREDLT